MDISTQTLYEEAIQFYIKNLNDFNQLDTVDGRNESIKWTSLATFKENWDIESEDLLTCWKNATKNSFIDTGYAAPTNGISKLLEHSEEVEGVRNAFRELFSEDNGNIDEREERIITFNEYINSRLLSYDPTSQFYLQKLDTTLTYLNLYDPDNNYRFKAIPAKKWAKYIGYSDYESGSDFKLSKYYKMCDNLLEVIKNQKTLIELHQQLLEWLNCKDYDRDLHVLTFDVLFCMWSKEAVLDEIKTKAVQLEEKQRIKQLNDSLLQLEEDMENYTKEIAAPDIITRQVEHKKYGVGYVQKKENGCVEVQFGDVRKKFKYPSCFEEGYLMIDDADLLKCFAKQNELNALIKSKKDEIEKIKKRMERPLLQA